MKKLGHYNLIQTDAGWHSTLCAGNNKVISYDPREWDKSEWAKVVLTHIQENRFIIDRRVSEDNKYYFCLLHYNTNNVAHESETYNTKQSMERGIKSVLANANTADVRIVDRRTKK